MSRTGALARFSITGPASARATRAAGLLDGLAATIISLIAVPLPAVRQLAAVLSPGWLGAAVSAVAMALIVFCAMWLYLAFVAVTWGRSPGMYVLGLGLDAPTKPTIGEASGWAAGWVAALIPAILGISSAYDPETGLPARFSGVATRSAGPAGGC